jgi:folate-binding protein YgfZ
VTAGLAEQVIALRSGAGAFLLPRDIYFVQGEDAETYLQGQLSQDIVALEVGQSTDSLLLQPDGKLTALVRVTRLDPKGFVVEVDGGYGDAILSRLKKFLLRSKVQMDRLEWRCLALRGDGVMDAARGLLGALSEGGVMALPFEWNDWIGIDLLGPKELVLDPATESLPPGIVACGEDAVESCRIVTGVPAMGSELTVKTIAAEAGLVERTVSFTKGCYTGQELVARLDSRGNNVPRRLVGVVGGSDPQADALSRGMTLHAGEAPPLATAEQGDAEAGAADVADAVADKVVGTITSATWSVELNAWVALAYLHRSVEAPGPIRIRSGDGLGGWQPARVALLPLRDVHDSPGLQAV